MWSAMKIIKKSEIGETSGRRDIWPVMLHLASKHCSWNNDTAIANAWVWMKNSWLDQLLHWLSCVTILLVDFIGVLLSRHQSATLQVATENDVLNAIARRKVRTTQKHLRTRIFSSARLPLVCLCFWRVLWAWPLPCLLGQCRRSFACHHSRCSVSVLSCNVSLWLSFCSCCSWKLVNFCSSLADFCPCPLVWAFGWFRRIRCLFSATVSRE